MHATPPPPKRGLAATLAILVHVLFFVLLVFSLDWKTHAPEPVMVELWQPPPPTSVITPNTVPAVQPTPPEPVKTEPVVPNPDIALAEQKRKLAAQQQRDAELLAQQQALQKQQKEKKAQQKQEKRDQQKLAQQQLLQKQQAVELAQEKLAEQKAAEQKKLLQKKQAALRKLVAQQTRAEFQNESAHALNSSRQAALASKQSAEQAQMRAAYREKIIAKVRGKIILPDGLQGNPSAEIDVTVLPTGEVVNVKLVKPSGQPAYDDAVERAILKASPLPLPPNAALAQQFRDLNLKFTPN